MSNAAERRAELEGRMSTLREQAAALTEQLERQTSQLREAQERATHLRGTATSPDGLVTVSVDASGGIADLRIAPTAFSRSTPEKLARSIAQTFASARASTQAQLGEAFGPLVQAPVVDLPDLLAGAPSLRNLFEQATRPVRPDVDPGRPGPGEPPTPSPPPAPGAAAPPGHGRPAPPGFGPPPGFGQPPPPGYGPPPGRPSGPPGPPRPAPGRRPDEDDDPEDEGGSIMRKGTW